ncbi:MAG: ATP-binding protein [Chlamydiales bacterium]
MKDPFYGRERELNILKELFDSTVARLVVLRGRRRIGKSTLAEQFGKLFDKCFTFTGLPPEEGVTDEMQRRYFVHELEKETHQVNLRFDDWDFLFDHLGRVTSKGKVLIIFDEINWMGSLDPAFLGKLKTAWDKHFKKNPKLVLLLSGSMSAWIEKHILRSTGFFGRIALDIVLQELPLNQCTHFWRSYEKNVSAMEKFKVLSITGGIPLYLELINPKISAEENIRRLCFRKEGFLFQEFNRIFSDVFGTRSAMYKKIVSSLIHGPKDQHSIFQTISVDKSGIYSEYLDELVKTGYIQRDYTWNIKSGNFSKLSNYRLCDNYLNFYLRYIEPYEANILQNRDFLPVGWTSIMGLQFENLVLNNRQLVQQLLGIPLSDIKIDNPYFQRKTQSKGGVQIDYLIQTRYNTLYICEIKFCKEPIGMEIINEMKQKLEKLVLPRGFSTRLVLLHVNGVKEEVRDEEFFSHIIDFGQFLERDR